MRDRPRNAPSVGGNVHMPRASSLPRLKPCVHPRQTPHTIHPMLPGAACMPSQCSQPQRCREVDIAALIRSKNHTQGSTSLRCALVGLTLGEDQYRCRTNRRSVSHLPWATVEHLLRLLAGLHRVALLLPASDGTESGRLV